MERGHQADALPPLLSQQLLTGRFEHYTTPHASFSSSSPVVAAEMLSFRLKGGKSRPSSGSGSGSSGVISSSSGSKQRTAGGIRYGKWARAKGTSEAAGVRFFDCRRRASPTSFRVDLFLGEKRV